MVEGYDFKMDLETLSLKDFMCYGQSTVAPADLNTFENVKPLLAELSSSHLGDLRCGYSIHEIDGQAGDVILKHNNLPVGVYLGQLLAIDPAHTGKALSVPLILAAIVHRAPPRERIYSEAGKKSLEKAWRVARRLEDDPWPLGASGLTALESP